MHSPDNPEVLAIGVGDRPRLVQGTMTIEKKTTTESASQERKLTVTPASFVSESEWKSNLLRKPELVRTDIFIQGLEPDEVEMIREASKRGLKPGGFSVEGNIVILRFDREKA